MGVGESFFLAVPEIAPGSVLTDSDCVPRPVPAGLKGLAAEQMRWCFTQASSLHYKNIGITGTALHSRQRLQKEGRRWYSCNATMCQKALINVLVLQPASSS